MRHLFAANFTRNFLFCRGGRHLRYLCSDFCRGASPSTSGSAERRAPVLTRIVDCCSAAGNKFASAEAKRGLSPRPSSYSRRLHARVISVSRAR